MFWRKHECNVLNNVCGVLVHKFYVITQMRLFSSYRPNNFNMLKIVFGIELEGMCIEIQKLNVNKSR